MTGDYLSVVWPVVSNNAVVQLCYQQMRERGESHNMAEMLATRSFPATKTDREFQYGRCNGNQFERCPAEGDWLRSKAEAAGVSTTGKFYCKGLADFPGDPTAWVSDRGDVLRVAKAKGMKVHGQVEYDPGECHRVDTKGGVEIADNIVDSVTDDYMDMDPGVRREDVREMVYNRLTGRAGDPEADLLVKEPLTDEF